MEASAHTLRLIGDADRTTAVWRSRDHETTQRGFLAVLAAAWLIAGIVGIPRSQGGLIAIELGLAIPLGLGGWLLWHGGTSSERP